MNIPTGLKTFLTRKPTLVAAIGVGALGLVGGTALALQNDHSQATAAPAPSTSPSTSPSCAPSGAAKAKRVLALGKVTAIDSSSITLQGAGGKSQTFAMSANTRVRGPKKAQLTLADVHVGDYVAVAHGNSKNAVGILDRGTTPPRAKAGAATAKPCPSPTG
jgi:hypothetical protein